MKKFFGLLLLIFISVSGYAQTSNNKDSTYYKNHFYINPFDLFFRTFTVSYERDINPNKNSIMINAGFLLEKTNTRQESGFNTELHYRINVFDYKTSKRGLVSNIFFAPYLQFRYVDHQEDRQYIDPVIYPPKTDPPQSQSLNANLRGYGAGVVMGIRTTAFNNRFCFSFYGGGGAKYTDVKGSQFAFSEGIAEENYTGITPKFGLQMGLSF